MIMRRIARQNLIFVVLSLFGLKSFHTLEAKETDSKINIQFVLSTNGNNIEFDQKSIEVPFGKTIVATFKNKAKKNSEIQHNIVVLKPGSEAEFVTFMQKESYDLEKLKVHKDIVAWSNALNPGESVTISFTPDKPGYYPYLCVMPGHGDMLGMKGMIHVKAKK